MTGTSFHETPEQPEPERRSEYGAVGVPVRKHCPDRRCVAVHTWTWLTDGGEPTGTTFICRPGAPS